MSLFKFVDKIIGTDFSGDKARKQIDQASAAGQAGNAAAAATMKQYGEEASRIYEKYVREGMDTFEAANKAEENGEVQHVKCVLEQSTANGPWRLTIHVIESAE